MQGGVGLRGDVMGMQGGGIIDLGPDVLKGGSLRLSVLEERDVRAYNSSAAQLKMVGRERGSQGRPSGLRLVPGWAAELAPRQHHLASSRLCLASAGPAVQAVGTV